MNQIFKPKRFSPAVRVIASLLIVVFLSTTILPPGYAQAIGLSLPVPGAMVNPTSAFVPVLLKGMTVHPDNPLQFDFIIDTGHQKLVGDDLKAETERLVKYFLASMTVPQNDLWVNLSPHEADRIIPDELAKTELGRDLLAQDYILKQLTATMMYPEEALGKKFWDRVYQLAKDQHGAADIPADTFNKVWILPESAMVYEHHNTVYIVESRLKVMLDSDYLAMQSEHQGPNKLQEEHASRYNDVVREIILPEIEREVNFGENFATLRQIYHSLILAKWYKQTVKNSIMSQVYVDQNKTMGIEINDPRMKEEIYSRYMQAYKKGVFNYIKEDYDVLSQTVIPRQYFSGGFQDEAMLVGKTDNALKAVNAKVGDEHIGRVEIKPEGTRRDDPAMLTEMPRPEMVQGLQQVVNYLAIQDSLPEQVDLLMVLGSQDLQVPLTAARLYKEGRARKILISGGAPAHLIDQTPLEEREANKFKALLIKEGVREADILVELNSTNTIQNIEFSKKLMEENGIAHDSVLLLQFPIGQRIAAELFKKHFGEYPVSYTPYVPDVSSLESAQLLNMTRGTLMFLGRLEVHGPEGLGFIDAVNVPQEIIDARERARQLYLSLESQRLIQEEARAEDEAIVKAMLEMKFAEQSQFNTALITEAKIQEAKAFLEQGIDFDVEIANMQLSIKGSEKQSSDPAMLTVRPEDARAYQQEVRARFQDFNKQAREFFYSENPGLNPPQLMQESLFHHIPVSGDAEVVRIYQDVQDIIQAIVGSQDVVDMNLGDIHVTIANDDVDAPEKFFLTLDQLRREVVEDAQGIRPFRITLVGPRVMKNGVVIMEFTTDAAEFLHLRRKAEARINDRKDKKLLSATNRAFAPNIIHSTVSDLRNADVSAEQLRALFERLNHYRESMTPVSITVNELVAAHLNEADRSFKDERVIPLGGDRAMLAQAAVIGQIQQNWMVAGLHVTTASRQYAAAFEGLSPDEAAEHLARYAKELISGGITPVFDNADALRITRRAFPETALAYFIRDNMQDAQRGIDLGANVLIGVDENLSVDLVRRIREMAPDVVLIPAVEYQTPDLMEYLDALIDAGADGIQFKPFRDVVVDPSTYVQLTPEFKEIIAQLRRRKPDVLIMGAGGIFQDRLSRVLEMKEKIIPAVGFMDPEPGQLARYDDALREQVARNRERRRAASDQAMLGSVSKLATVVSVGLGGAFAHSLAIAQVAMGENVNNSYWVRLWETAKDNPVLYSLLTLTVVTSLANIFLRKYLSKTKGENIPDELRLSNEAFKKAVLLYKLLNMSDKDDNVAYFREKSFEWMRSDNRWKKTIGLNLVRFLFKEQHIPYSKKLLDEILKIFFDDSSFAVKLAAIGILGAMQTSPNPMDQLDRNIAEKFRKFWLSSQKGNNALKNYQSTGVQKDIQTELVDSDTNKALKNAISKINAGDPAMLGSFFTKKIDLNKLSDGELITTLPKINNYYKDFKEDYRQVGFLFSLLKDQSKSKQIRDLSFLALKRIGRNYKTNQEFDMHMVRFFIALADLGGEEEAFYLADLYTYVKRGNNAQMMIEAKLIGKGYSLNSLAELLIKNPINNLSDSAMLGEDPDVGGIDMNEINLNHAGENISGDGSGIQFNMQGMEPLLNMDIQGFSPVIINMMPINSVLPLLGLMPTEKGIKYGQEEAAESLQLSSVH